MLDDWEEIASDLSVLHRIDNPDDMDSRRFWRLAPHLASYQGAVAAKRLRTEPPDLARQETPPMPTAPQAVPYAAAPPRPGVHMIGATAAEIGMSEVMRDLISIGDGRV